MPKFVEFSKTFSDMVVDFDFDGNGNETLSHSIYLRERRKFCSNTFPNQLMYSVANQTIISDPIYRKLSLFVVIFVFALICLGLPQYYCGA